MRRAGRCRSETHFAPHVKRVTYRVPDALRGSTGHRALLDNNGPGLRIHGHVLDSPIKRGHVGGSPCPDPRGLRRGVDRQENHIRSGDADLSITREEEVRSASRNVVRLAIASLGAVAWLLDNCAVSCQPHNLVQARLMNGEVSGVPAFDASLVSVQNLDANFGVVQRNDCRCRTT